MTSTARCAAKKPVATAATEWCPFGMQAIRAPFIGIVVAVALLCVENIGANVYRAHVAAERARVDAQAVQRRDVDQLIRRIREVDREIERLQPHTM